jgi:hypothetical protein
VKDSNFEMEPLTFRGKETIVLAGIDLKERAFAAETWGFFKHRKPDEYGDLVR